MSKIHLAWWVKTEMRGVQKEWRIYIVAAMTERSAKNQVSRSTGKGWRITRVSPIIYPHAWRADMRA